MNRLGSILGFMLIAIFAVLTPSLHASPASRDPAANSALAASFTLNPVADAYVDSSNPATNYGTSTQIRVDGSPIVNSYLRFDVSGLSGAVTQATLRIYANSSLTSGYTAQAVSDNTWGETTITYGNAPAMGATLGSAGAISSGTWTSVDVTAYVTSNGTYSFGLTDPSTTALSLASRESTNPPQLVIQTGTTATSTPTLVTPAATNTPTLGPTPTDTPTQAATNTPTSAATNTPTATGTPSTNTLTPTPTPKGKHTPKPTPTLTPGATNTPTLGPTPTHTPAATNTPTPGPTNTPTPGPTNTLTATGTPSTNPAVPNFSHVYVILMENKEYGDIVGSSSAPYINSLIAQYGLATEYDAVTHPSEPNYFALFSGSTQGATDDGTYNLSARNLADQAEASGRSWDMFAQNVPLNCYTGSTASDGEDGSGNYARKHEPAISFTDISGNSSRCAHITDFTHFDPSAANFEFITPNLCNDMHDCSIATGDTFLQGFVPGILNSSAWQNGGVLFIVWDEGTTNTGGGGHVAMLVIAKNVTAGTTSATPHNHYSLLRTIEDAWGLGCLANTCSANNLAEFFH